MEVNEINSCLNRWQQHHDENAVTDLYNGLTQFFYYLQTQSYCKGVDAESILNEAFNTAINECDLSKAQFKTFLAFIFKNKCLSYRRRFSGSLNRMRDFVTVDPTIRSDKADKKFSLNNVAEKSDITKQELLEAIESLSDQTDSSILRQFLEGKSQVEIRQNLGLGDSRSYMKYRLNKAVSNLREVYQD